VLILRLSYCQWSLPLIGEGEDDGMQWRSSRCPSVGCLALDAEQRPSNGMGHLGCLNSGSFSPFVLPYSLYNEIGRVHDGLGEVVYGLQRRAMDHGGVVELKKT
jgi:hypothetical protein